MDFTSILKTPLLRRGPFLEEVRNWRKPLAGMSWYFPGWMLIRYTERRITIMDKRDQILRGTKGTADGRRVLFVFLMALMAIVLGLLAGCGPATPVVIEKEVPVEVEKPVVKTVVIEQEVPVEVEKEVAVETAVVETVKAIADDVPKEPPFPIPIIPVPEVAIEKMHEIAQGLAEAGLVVKPVPFFNAKRATSYALPSLGQSDEGLLLMAAPVTESLETKLAELSELPGLALGGFHLPQGIGALPPGQYVARVFFEDGEPQAELYDEQFRVVSDVPMVVRGLQVRKVIEPEVAITAREMCFTQTTLQACLQLPPPLSLQVVDRMKQAMDELSEAGLLEVDIDADGTVPDIEGVKARSICAETVGEEPERCWPSVLAASAFEFRTEPVEGESPITQKATAGVLVVLEEIHDEVWSAETGELTTLPPGNYVVDFLETFDGRWLALLTSPDVEATGAGVEELSSPADFSDAAVFINFDELPNGSHVTTQYADKGVTFIDVRDTSHRITQAPPGFSPPNLVYHYRGPDDENRKLPLTMVFGEPQAKVGFYFLPASKTEVTLTAYDALGQAIYQWNLYPVASEWQFVGILSRAKDISRVTLDYGDSFQAEGIDDLYFESNAGPAQFLMIAESQPERTEVLGEPIQGEPPPVPESQVVIKNLNWDFIIQFCLFRWMECP